MAEEEKKFGEGIGVTLGYEEGRRRGDLSSFTKNIGYMFVSTFLFVVIALMWPTIARGTDPSSVALLMIGNLSGAALTVLAFLYGSSDGSKKKDDSPMILPPIQE